MVNQLKFFTLSLFLILGTTVYSNNIVIEPLSTEPESNVCPYLTPTNFQAVAFGGDFIRLSWTQPGAPPPFYNIKAFMVSSGAMVYNTTFPNTMTNNHTVPVPFPGTEYRFELCPLTANQLCCVPPAITTGRSIIIDILVGAFVPDYPIKLCSINVASIPQFPTQYCTFNTANAVQTSFRVQKDGNNIHSRVFGLSIPNSQNGRYELELSPNNPQNYSFTCTQGMPTCSTMTVQIYHIDVPNEPIAVLELIGSATGTTKIYCTSIKSAYEIVLLAPNNPQAIDASDERFGETQFDLTSPQVTASPNPFTNRLDVQIPFSTEENDVKISLYDLQGRLVIHEILPGGPQMRNLSTENLLSGLYLLRVDTGNRSETIKVMKTQ